MSNEPVIKGHGWADHGKQTMTHAGMTHTCHMFTKGECRVLVSRENHGSSIIGAPGGKLRYHLSISCANRYPTWEEIKDARYCLLPLGLTFAQILPPPNEYTNIHPNCFHLWEIDGNEW